MRLFLRDPALVTCCMRTRTRTRTLHREVPRDIISGLRHLVLSATRTYIKKCGRLQAVNCVSTTPSCERTPLQRSNSVRGSVYHKLVQVQPTRDYYPHSIYRKMSLEEIIATSTVLYSDGLSDSYCSYCASSKESSPAHTRNPRALGTRMVMDDKDKTIYNSLGSSSSTAGKVIIATVTALTV